MTIKKQWPSGTGEATITYDGSGSGQITISSDDNNLYEARYMQIVVITAAGSPQQTKTVNISQAARVRTDISNAVVTAANQTYSGSAKTPEPTVKLNGVTIPSTGYDVTYSNNTNAGTATVTVTGKGDYTGTVSGTFTIAQATGSISFIASSMTATRTGTIYGITVTALNSGWEKTTAKTVSGYNVFRSCSNKGENNSFSVLKLQFVNNTGSSITTTVKMGPTCESSYDFAYIAAWNASDITSNTVPSSPLWSGSGKTAEWTDVSLTIPTGTNTLQIVYRKDSSVNNSPDCGYLAIPFDINFSTMLNHITKTGDGAVTYSSNKTSVATVNSSTGVITIKGTGTATITASMAATTNFTAASATFTVTVTSSNSCTEALTVSITKDTGSGSLSSASVALKYGSTSIKTFTTSSTSANIAWGFNYKLVPSTLANYLEPDSVTKNWGNVTSKSVSFQYKDFATAFRNLVGSLPTLTDDTNKYVMVSDSSNNVVGKIKKTNLYK